MLSRHLPCLQPFVYRAFISLTGGGEVIVAWAAFMQGSPAGNCSLSLAQRKERKETST